MDYLSSERKKGDMIFSKPKRKDVRRFCLFICFIISLFYTLEKRSRQQRLSGSPYLTTTWSLRNICVDRFLFVYDTPAIFTSDLISESKFELTPGTKYSQWQSEYYLHQILKEHSCRTRDPESAKIFYIPLYGSGMRAAGVRDRGHLKDLLFKWLEDHRSKSGVPYVKRMSGRDHVISLGAARSWCKRSQPQQRTSKCLGFSHNDILDSNFIKLSVEFTGLRAKHFFREELQKKVSRIIIVPYLQFDVFSAYGHTFFNGKKNTIASIETERKYLLTFSGSLLPKTAPFRAAFKKICDQSPDCLFRDTKSSRQVINSEVFENSYRNSVFCAVLGGDTRASKRFFDAISSLCIPVTFDPFLVLPFPTSVPYEKMIVSAPFISSSSVVSDILTILRNFSASDIQSFRTHISKYKRYLSYFTSEKPNAVDMIIDRLHANGNAIHHHYNRSFDIMYSDWKHTKKRICDKVSEKVCESAPTQFLNI